MGKFVFFATLSAMCAALVFPAESRAKNSGKTDKTKVSEPSTRELLEVLIRSGDTRISTSAKGCKDIEGPAQKKDYTLGNYLSFLVSSLDPTHGQSGVTSTCKVKTKSRECEVMFRTGIGTGSPWNYGIQFEIDRDGKILPDSIACPGAA